MKKFSNIVLMFLICLILTGCQSKNLPYSTISQDNYNTGGELTFVYDEITHTAHFGGEGEVVQYYKANIAKGWTEEGCRVGIIINLPANIDDFSSGKTKIGDKEVSADEYIIQENDNIYAIFQPVVSEENRVITLEITWQDGIALQTYTIVIENGTLFMPAPTEEINQTIEIDASQNRFVI